VCALGKYNLKTNNSEIMSGMDLSPKIKLSEKS
jgi:hypothetical protein